MFKVNPDGSDFTVISHFTNTTISQPWAGMVARGNTLFGTSILDGPGMGTVYQINTDGTGFSILHGCPYGGSGDSSDGGGYPIARLLLAGNTLYGTAGMNGLYGNGTVFSIQLPSPPVISIEAATNAVFSFSWNANVGVTYQVQYVSDPSSSNWTNLGEAIVATNAILSATDSISGNSQRFYRVVGLP